MVECTTLKATKADQCRLNAQSKSEKKRQAVLEAIVALQQQGRPITKAAVKKYANVSYPFLKKHEDLLQTIDEAENTDKARRLSSASNAQGKDVAIAAMQRQMEKWKKESQEKTAEIRRKQREIDQLYGKLAGRSEMTDAELRARLAEALQRLQSYESAE